jgi:hypothetical protein
MVMDFTTIETQRDRRKIDAKQKRCNTKQISIQSQANKKKKKEE